MCSSDLRRREGGAQRGYALGRNARRGRERAAEIGAGDDQPDDLLVVVVGGEVGERRHVEIGRLRPLLHQHLDGAVGQVGATGAVGPTGVVLGGGILSPRFTGDGSTTEFGPISGWDGPQNDEAGYLVYVGGVFQRPDETNGGFSITGTTQGNSKIVFPTAPANNVVIDVVAVQVTGAKGATGVQGATGPAGSGGGGAGSVGANANPNTTQTPGGNGGSGVSSSITGSSVGRAGGGGGGGRYDSGAVDIAGGTAS